MVAFSSGGGTMRNCGVRMQRNEADGIIISCDFCGTDWDGQAAMVEGHHGSVICLNCVKKALEVAAVGEDKYECTLCLRHNIPASLPRWTNQPKFSAVVCQECLHQAAKALSKAPHAQWKWQGGAKK